MTTSEPRHSRQVESKEPEAEYHAISALAMVAMAAGTGSLLALATMRPGLAIIPAVGIVLAVAALVRIARSDGLLVGRKPALAGLVLSVLCLSGLASYWTAHRWLVRREARVFAAAWFDLLTRDEPLKAEQLTRNPEHRKPLDNRLWDFYQSDPDALKAAQDFVGNSVVRTLLALGQKAQVRYYESQDQVSNGPAERVNLVYAVTYPDAGGSQKKSFFIRLRLERFHFDTTGRGDWTVLKADGGIRPWALGGDRDELDG